MQTRNLSGDARARRGRLAPGIYLAFDALTLGPNGNMRVGGQGAVADWLVCLQRLPGEHMLDERIRRGDITAHELSRLAARLTQFYQSCAAERISAAEYVAPTRRRKWTRLVLAVFEIALFVLAEGAVICVCGLCVPSRLCVEEPFPNL